MSAVRMDGKALSAKVRGSILAETEELKKEGRHAGTRGHYRRQRPGQRDLCAQQGARLRAVRLYSEKVRPARGDLAGRAAWPDCAAERKPADFGILCQMPVPKHISEQAVIDAIDPKKDVDAFHPVNVGKIMVGNFDFVPCTPAGVMELLDEYKIDPKGKECVVVGRSNIVGKPMAMLLLHRHGTVTICHSRTQDLAEVCRRADILVAAVGKAGFITPDMVKGGCGRHRRRHQPQRRGQGLRRRCARGNGQGVLYDPGPGRCRPDDHHHADEEYAQGGKAPAQPLI